MAEQRSEQTPDTQARETAQAAQAKDKTPDAYAGAAEHGGVFSTFRDLVAANSGQEPPPEQFSPLFQRSEWAHPVNDTQRARVLGALQRQYGNRYVQRVLAPGAKSHPRTSTTPAFPIFRSEDDGAHTAPSLMNRSVPSQIESSSGQALNGETQQLMQSRFGQDFNNVRVHDDAHAHEAAKNLSAEAFTTGRDIYFSPGAYNPSTPSGQRLLAHELSHVVQQDSGAAAAAAAAAGPSTYGYHVSQPGDHLERQADAASDAVMRGELFPPITSSSSVPTIARQASGGGGGGAGTGGTPAPAATGARDGTRPESHTAAPGDFPITIAGMTVNLPTSKWLDRVAPGGRVPVPGNFYKVLSVPGFKVTGASLDLDENKAPKGATIDVAVNIPPLDGTGSLTVDKSGSATGTAHINFHSSKIPGIKETTVDAAIRSDGFDIDAALEFDLPKVTGTLNYKYQNKQHSGKGTAKYEGSKLKGEIEIILSEAAKLSGSGKLEMELFKGLRGEVDVDVNEKRDIKVRGTVSLPGEVELFPEKKFEKNFFTFEKKFPLWGITIPVIDVNVGLFAEIHAGAGFRSKFGPGVLRDIKLTGEFGTDPEAATEFGLSGEFFVPAGAEVVINAGGGIGLGLAIADITGGIEAVGVAGLYTALSVRPQFQYAGGKYTITGVAELAGVAQARFGINAFAKIDVGVWMFKGTVWRKDWKLAEWVWNSGLNVSLRATISYTLGDDFNPEIKFETPEVDPEKLIKDVMPESGSPVSAPPKPAVPEKGGFNAEGAEGKQAEGAAQAGTETPTAGSPSAKTQASTGGDQKQTGVQGAKPEEDPPIVAKQRTPDGRHEIKITEGGEVLRYSSPGALRAAHSAIIASHRDLNSWLSTIEQKAKNKATAADAALEAATFDDVMTTLEGGLASGALVIEPGRTLLRSEARLAAHQLKEGHKLVAKVEGTSRTGDFEIDGKPTEGKEVSNITSGKPAGAVARRILAGAGQAPNIIVDTRPQKDITEPIAREAIRQAYVFQLTQFNRGEIPSLRIEQIRVIGDGYDTGYVPRPS
ncbi:MAG TPA: DUF4157 domain-containing protein [Pyrinomonadaceae bacterium]|jgi:hypothetical protein